MTNYEAMKERAEGLKASARGIAKIFRKHGLKARAVIKKFGDSYAIFHAHKHDEHWSEIEAKKNLAINEVLEKGLDSADIFSKHSEDHTDVARYFTFGLIYTFKKMEAFKSLKEKTE